MSDVGKSDTCTETGWRIYRCPSASGKSSWRHGQASEHYLHPKSGWITYYMKSDQDVKPVIELFRLNYHRPWLQKERK